MTPLASSFRRALHAVGTRVLEENRVELVKVGGNLLSRLTAAVVNGEFARQEPAPEPEPEPTDSQDP